MTAFTEEELERYARHIVLHEIGGPGQQRLKAARVLVIGAGGLGSPALLYLAAAGVGTLGCVDYDAVSLSNLQRQVVHGTEEVGRPKVESAGRTVLGRVGSAGDVVEALLFLVRSEFATGSIVIVDGGRILK